MFHVVGVTPDAPDLATTMSQDEPLSISNCRQRICLRAGKDSIKPKRKPLISSH
jgi:hypothetical protein